MANFNPGHRINGPRSGGRGFQNVRQAGPPPGSRPRLGEAAVAPGLQPPMGTTQDFWKDRYAQHPGVGAPVPQPMNTDPRPSGGGPTGTGAGPETIGAGPGIAPGLQPPMAGHRPSPMAGGYHGEMPQGPSKNDPGWVNPYLDGPPPGSRPALPRGAGAGVAPGLQPMARPGGAMMDGGGYGPPMNAGPGPGNLPMPGASGGGYGPGMPGVSGQAVSGQAMGRSASPFNKVRRPGLA